MVEPLTREERIASVIIGVVINRLRSDKCLVTGAIASTGKRLY